MTHTQCFTASARKILKLSSVFAVLRFLKKAYRIFFCFHSTLFFFGRYAKFSKQSFFVGCTIRASTFLFCLEPVCSFLFNHVCFHFIACLVLSLENNAPIIILSYSNTKYTQTCFLFTIHFSAVCGCVCLCVFCE